MSFGHWVLDTIGGVHHRGVIVTLAERRTGHLKCRAVKHKTKRAFANAIKVMTVTLADTVKTITFESGGEFADYRQIADHLKCDIYFTKPYHASVRGTNRNLNGEVRRYDLKHEPLDHVECVELAKIEDQINVHNRKNLDYLNTTEHVANERTLQRE